MEKRTLIVLLSIVLVVFISYNQLLNSGAFILLVLIIVLVLSELFDDLSFGRLISMTRELEKKKTEKEELERKNEQLLNQILKISGMQNKSHEKE